MFKSEKSQNIKIEILDYCLSWDFIGKEESDNRVEIHTNYQEQDSEIKETYECLKCNVFFLSYLEFKDHRLEEHQEFESHVVFKEDSDTGCFVPEVNTINEDNLKAEKNTLIKDTSNNKSSILPINTLKQSTSSNVKPNIMNESNFKCDVCSKSFGLRIALRRHLKVVHLKFKQYHCEECQKSFTFPLDLRRHQETHFEGKFPCVKCNKIFTREINLYKHNRRYHVLKVDLVCSICNDRWIGTRYSLTLHRKSHLK